MFFADGFEEMEAIAPVDLLRRAGVEVCTVGVGKKLVRGAHSILLETDVEQSFAVLENLEGVVLPGGQKGVEGLAASPVVHKAVRFAAEQKKMLAAICAGPSVLGQMGLLSGVKATCYPGFEEQLKGARVTQASVCIDQNMITARGAGVATEFALALVAYLKGQDEATRLAGEIQCGR